MNTKNRNFALLGLSTPEIYNSNLEVYLPRVLAPSEIEYIKNDLYKSNDPEMIIDNAVKYFKQELVDVKIYYYDEDNLITSMDYESHLWNLVVK